MVGVAIVGRPVARTLDDHWTVEVTEDDGPETVIETRYAHIRVAHKPEAKIVIRCEEVRT